MASTQDRNASRLFRVGRLEFDEGRRLLRVDGQRRQVEAKPLDLLYQLLCRPGEVVTKEELITAAWGTADYTSEASLMTAMSKLRTALGETNKDLIESVRGFGYRIGAKVEIVSRSVEPPLAPMLKQGDEVPMRPGWHLEQLLGMPSTNDVWLARETGTDERRVFKFAYTAVRLNSIKREAFISRVLYEMLGERSDIVRITGRNFEAPPFFIESAYGGPDLRRWLRERGAASDLPIRLALVAEAARAVAAAHAAGVLHSDLKPSNILIEEDATATPRARLLDFGAGGLTEAARASTLPPSFGTIDIDADQRLGSLRYLAPEVAEGASSNAGSDIYALGVLLYQMIVGNLDRPLTPGWENDVDEPLLRQDIAEAASGDFTRRMPSATLLAERLETLDERRGEQARRDREKAGNERLAREVERARLRRPWIAATALALLVGIGFTTSASLRAVRERDLAVVQRERAEQISRVTEKTVSGLVDDIAHGLGDKAELQLSILQELLEQAEATLVKMIRLSPYDPELYRLEARALIEFTKTYLQKGDVQKALNSSQHAASIQQKLLESNSGDIGLALDLANSQSLIGDTKMKQYDKHGALAAYQTTQHILVRLVAANPLRADLQPKLARAEGAVGDVYMAQDGIQQALKTYQHARSILAQSFTLHAHEPDWLLSLSLTEGKIGDALEALKDWQGALAAYQADLAICSKLVTLDSGNNAWRHALSVAESDVGDEQLHLKDFKSALASYQASLTLDIELAHSDPSNAIWQRNIAVGYSDIGDVKSDLADSVGAVAAYRSTKLIIDDLALKNPADVSLRRDVVATNLNIADGMINNGDPVGGAPYALKALKLVRKLATAYPDDPELANTVKLSQDVIKRAGFKP